jgi:hypothetical protein
MPDEHTSMESGRDASLIMDRSVADAGGGYNASDEDDDDNEDKELDENGSKLMAVFIFMQKTTKR